MHRALTLWWWRPYARTAPVPARRPAKASRKFGACPGCSHLCSLLLLLLTRRSEHHAPAADAWGLRKWPQSREDSNSIQRGMRKDTQYLWGVSGPKRVRRWQCRSTSIALMFCREDHNEKIKYEIKHEKECGHTLWIGRSYLEEINSPRCLMSNRGCRWTAAVLFWKDVTSYHPSMSQTVTVDEVQANVRRHWFLSLCCVYAGAHSKACVTGAFLSKCQCATFNSIPPTEPTNQQRAHKKELCC